MPRLPSRAKLIRAIKSTASIMDRLGKTTGPMRRDLRRFFEQHAKWLREQVKRP